MKAEKYKTTPALPGSNDALSKSNNPVENGIGVNTSPPGASALSSGPSRQFSDSQPPKQASSIGTGDVDLTEKDATTLRVQSISHPQTGLSREGSSRPMARRGRGRPRGSTKRKSEIRAPAPDYTKLAGSTSMRAAVKASLLEAAGQHSTTSAADRTHLSASASRKIVSETETSLEGDSSSESSGDYETSLDPGNPFRVGTRFDNYVAIQTALAVWNDQNCPGHIVKRYYLRQESRTNKPNVRCSLQQKKHVDCDFRIVFHPSERDDESYVVDQVEQFFFGNTKHCLY